MRDTGNSFWPTNWLDPSRQRPEKPRSTGLTMVIDKGLGLQAFQDVLDIAAPFIDIYKLGFGTSVLYPLEILKTKIDKAKAHGIDIMPGGTFCEIACTQASFESYLSRVKELGYNAIEISDGTFSFSRKERDRMIDLAAREGLKVFAEFGKKAEGFCAEMEELVSTLQADLQAGASFTIVEARESGTVGIFNRQGEVDDAFLQAVERACGAHRHRLIWEAPRKNQQLALLHTLGLDVNLGNIATGDIMAVETLRRGLRGDTAAKMCAEGRKRACD